MIFTTPLPFIKEFIDQLDQGIRAQAPTRKLSKAQRWWLSFCLMGILLSNAVCWAAFERVGLGHWSQVKDFLPMSRPLSTCQLLLASGFMGTLQNPQ